MENCCESLVKYFMVFFNILFILAGCVLIGFGAWSQIASKVTFFSKRSFWSWSFHLGLPELPGRELCEHSNLPDDRRWCDLPGGLLGLLWRLEGEQVPDLHLRFLPRCYPRRSGTTSSHPFKNRTNLFRPFEHWTNLLLGRVAPLNS